MSSRLILVERCFLKEFRNSFELETRAEPFRTRHLNTNVFGEQRNNAEHGFNNGR